MALPAVPSRVRAGVLVLVLATTGATSGSLPPIVFVSRERVPGEPGAIPGLGPHHRAIITGGRLLVREPDGRTRELLPPGAFRDVSDPSVAPDAQRVAFAGVAAGDRAWRIWRVDLAGGTPIRITSDPGGSARVDDLDPCWIDDSTLVFASTREPQRAQYADVPVTNLFRIVDTPGGRSRAPERITAERNGAEEPAMDWTRGRILFARWWFNRYRAADDSIGITTDPEAAIARDTVNLWQALEMAPRARMPRLAAGDLRTRRGTMGYQPAALGGGVIASVYAANLGLSPRPGATGIHATKAIGRERRLAGAIVSGKAGDAYAGTEGLSPPSACAPAGLPDGRVLFSYDPGARGDFGLYVMDRDGEHVTRVLDLEGTLELDATPAVRRRPPPREKPLAGNELSGGKPGENTFRYHDIDVFEEGNATDPARGSARRIQGARLRFFATVSRPDHPGGDSAYLVREVPLMPSGEVDEPGLPADTPMFEQLVDQNGRVLMTAHGPAHVAGSNAGVAGTTTRCVGCHLGHSTLQLPSRRAPRIGL